MTASETETTKALADWLFGAEWPLPNPDRPRCSEDNLYLRLREILESDAVFEGAIVESGRGVREEQWVRRLPPMSAFWQREIESLLAAGRQGPIAPHLQTHYGHSRLRHADAAITYGARSCGDSGLDWQKGKPHSVQVSPYLDQPKEVGAAVEHECVHSALPPGSGHGKVFQAACKAVGLVMVNRAGRTEIDDGLHQYRKKFPGSEKGRALAAHLQKLTTHLGSFPARAIPRPPPPEPRNTVTTKLVCPACRITVRAGPSTMEKVRGGPRIGCINPECERCGEPLLTPEECHEWRTLSAETAGLRTSNDEARDDRPADSDFAEIFR